MEIGVHPAVLLELSSENHGKILSVLAYSFVVLPTRIRSSPEHAAVNSFRERADTAYLSREERRSEL